MGQDRHPRAGAESRRHVAVIEKAAITLVAAGLIAWATWASLSISDQGKDVAFIKGTLKQIEKRLEGK